MSLYGHLQILRVQFKHLEKSVHWDSIKKIGTRCLWRKVEPDFHFFCWVAEQRQRLWGRKELLTSEFELSFLFGLETTFVAFFLKATLMKTFLKEHEVHSAVILGNLTGRKRITTTAACSQPEKDFWKQRCPIYLTWRFIKKYSFEKLGHFLKERLGWVGLV